MTLGGMRVPKYWAAALCITLLLGAAGMTTYLCLPPEDWAPPRLQFVSTSRGTAQETHALTLADLAVVWRRDLRQSVVDKPAPQPGQGKDRPDRLAVRLVGTAVEHDRQFGVFQLANARTVVRAVGDDVDGYRIIEIARGRARLRNGEREYDLRVPWYEQIAIGSEE